MTDLDPAIWENKTLGSASKLPFLDEIEAQELENRSAKAEGREPLVAIREDNYPAYAESGSIPSYKASRGKVVLVEANSDSESDSSEKEETLKSTKGDKK